MNSLERRLIELNEALLKLSSGESVDNDLLKKARQALSGAIIDTGPGNDTVIINKTINKNDCEPCPPGPPGFTGSQGDMGYTGSQGDMGYTGSQGDIGYTGSQGDCECECDAKVVSEDYTVQSSDYYVGVDADGPVTITLPCGLEECREIIIKAEMGPPLGNRKITIVTDGDCTIDDADQYVIEVPYQSVRLLSRGGQWRIV
jgi:hypothetical protein